MKLLRIKLPHTVIVKSPGLLPMLYSVRELAQAVGLAERTLRDWLGNGLPHSRDGQGHLWIHGREFADWAASHRRVATKPKLLENQAYCMHCREVVEILEPKTKTVRGKLTHTQGKCNRCGHAIHRGGRAISNPVSTPPNENRQCA